MIRSKLGQRMLGVFLFVIGVGGTTWVWHTALTDGYFERKPAALFPVFAVVGLTMILFPIDVDKLRAEHGVEKVHNFRQAPWLWRILIFVALAAGLGNWFALEQL